MAVITAVFQLKNTAARNGAIKMGNKTAPTGVAEEGMKWIKYGNKIEKASIANVSFTWILFTNDARNAKEFVSVIVNLF